MANIARLGVALGLNNAEFVSGIAAAGKKLEEFADKDSDLDKAITDKLLRCSEGHITCIGCFK